MHFHDGTSQDAADPAKDVLVRISKGSHWRVSLFFADRLDGEGMCDRSSDSQPCDSDSDSRRDLWADQGPGRARKCSFSNWRFLDGGYGTGLGCRLRGLDGFGCLRHGRLGGFSGLACSGAGHAGNRRGGRRFVDHLSHLIV